ncbi:hypothetical protein SBOR_5685 [Sclerotinia borealis F-4128]|uniref:Uncharacterized protein n=1 Tax=Sclerotinia borealis (strain F-4128) TaxID=1432307 RepID=W9CDI7_SCLBF|nr:hypothetical protein SBOR_5685 [Sclerotinia borealis F-4128]
MSKRKLSVNTDNVWSVVGEKLENLSHKKPKSDVGSSPNSKSTTVSTPVSNQMESVEFSSTIKMTEDKPFVDLTIPTSPASSSNLSSAPTDIINIDNQITAEDTMDVNEPNTISTPDPEKTDKILCTIKFNDLYYLDFQTPFTQPDLFFDLTQDPSLWVAFFERSIHTRHTADPSQYIQYCLSAMRMRSGNCRDLLAVFVFAFIFEDDKDSYGFWTTLYRLLYWMMDFENASGQKIVYLGRIVMPGGLLRGCWNKVLQRYLQDEDYLGPIMYFTVTEESGFRWIKPEAGENLTKECSFEDNWVIELPRNEYAA